MRVGRYSYLKPHRARLAARQRCRDCSRRLDREGPRCRGCNDKHNTQARARRQRANTN